ncbi:LysM peptidoglycan-binding domain-containing protein [Phytohabitans aurantiacus]|uniref:LysM peptidoglycan-binding domain-containing protein n=1 Tax=Phytohabitans aurantiacus TaxID=3016789 RepID=UPI002492DB92|nr:LysM peptidoglycan-binding domain-containing protein [Phytohabitans aurantiacus]
MGVRVQVKPRLRLTRRGRFVLFALFLLLSAGVIALGATASRAADPPTETVTTVVRPGDTLWSIAGRHFPDHDPVASVETIRRVNRLDGYGIYAGQELILPHDR